MIEALLIGYILAGKICLTAEGRSLCKPLKPGRPSIKYVCDDQAARLANLITDGKAEELGFPKRSKLKFTYACEPVRGQASL
jgi:hypothetical protein